MSERLRLVHSYKDYYPPVIGGMERHMATLCTHFAKTYDVTAVVCSRTWRGSERHVDGVRVVETPTLARFRSAPLPIGYGRRLAQTDADLLHFHMPNPTCEFAALHAGLRGRFVATYQSDIVRQRLLRHVYAPMQRQFLARCVAIIATTPHYVDTSPVLQSVRDKIEIIPLGIDTGFYATLPPGHEQRVDEMRARFGDPFLLFVGRLRYYKGVTVLLEAMSSLRAQLAIVGTGMEEAALRAQASAAGLQDRVHFLGDVDEDTLRVLYHACGVFVLPAIARSEAYGLVQLEAHSAGTPVVSTALRTGVDYVNADGETGLIVPPGDAGALAGALQRLLDDPEYRRQLGTQAQARARRDFDETVMLERIGDLYRRVLER